MKRHSHKSFSASKKPEGLMVYGRHVVLAALETEQKVEQLFLQKESPAAELVKLEKEASRQSIPCRRLEKTEIAQLCHSEEHQGVAARIRAFPLLTTEHFIEHTEGENPPAIILILDEIQDPGNFGGIIRSAVAFNILDIVVPAHRSCPVTGAVAKASAGTLFKARIYQVTNLATLARRLKEKSRFWIYGADAGGTSPLSIHIFQFPVALVIGNEHSGIGHSLTKELDGTFFIPTQNQVESLNANQSLSIIAYQVANRLAESEFLEASDK